MAARPPAPAECAQCGEPIPPGARACPHCGADERTGWRETSLYDGLDLPDSAFEAEAPRPSPPPVRRVNGLAWYWWAVAAALLVALAVAFIGTL